MKDRVPYKVNVSVIRSDRHEGKGRPCFKNLHLSCFSLENEIRGPSHKERKNEKGLCRNLRSSEIHSFIDLLIYFDFFSLVCSKLRKVCFT